MIDGWNGECSVIVVVATAIVVAICMHVIAWISVITATCERWHAHR